MAVCDTVNPYGAVRWRRGSFSEQLTGRLGLAHGLFSIQFNALEMRS